MIQKAEESLLSAEYCFSKWHKWFSSGKYSVEDDYDRADGRQMAKLSGRQLVAFENDRCLLVREPSETIVVSVGTGYNILTTEMNMLR